MNLSDLPPELISQAPLAAVLWWIGVQARKELLAGITRLEQGLGGVRGELRSLRRDLGQQLIDDEEPYPGPNGAARP